MRRLGLLLALTASALIAIPGTAAAWHYTFQDFFDIEGSAFSSGRATAEKCGPGGKLGTYKYRSFTQGTGGETELAFEVLAKLSVREKFKRLQDVEVSYEASPNIPPDIVEQAAAALLDFHETVFTRFKPGKLQIRHGSLVLFGNEVLAPGETSTKFKPKPGC